MKVTLNSNLKHDGTRFERHTAAVLVADQAAADAVIAQGGKPLIATPAQREAWLTRGVITALPESDSPKVPSGPSEPTAAKPEAETPPPDGGTKTKGKGK